MNSDGTKKRFLGKADTVHWINNYKILMRIDNKNYIVKNGGRIVSLTKNDWAFQCKTGEEEVIFSVDERLYLEKDGEETEIMDLPWVCDRVYANSSKGPYVAVVNKEDGIFLINKKHILRIGNLKNKIQANQNKKEADLNITFSTDGRTIGFIQEEEGLLKFNFINLETEIENSVLLNLPIHSDVDYQGISTAWVSNSVILVFSESRWCAVNIKEEIQLFSQSMPEGHVLYGVLSK